MSISELSVKREHVLCVAWMIYENAIGCYNITDIHNLTVLEIPLSYSALVIHCTYLDFVYLFVFTYQGDFFAQASWKIVSTHTVYFS